MINTFDAIPVEGLFVEVPGPSSEGSTYYTEMQTALFRFDSCLAEAVVLAKSVPLPNRNFNLLSAACSTGAELDSTLKLLELAGIDRVDATGIDANEIAIEQAKRGQHKVVIDERLQPKRQAIETALAELGFDLLMGDNLRRTVVDTSRLRAGHKVDFKVHNLTEEIEQRDVDLVVASNVLFHVDLVEEGAAKRVASNLAKTLSDNGILNFGVLSGGVIGLAEDPRSITEMLKKKYDLVPVSLGSHGHPRIFARG